MAKVFQVGIVRKVDRGKVSVEIARATSCGENCASCKTGCSGTGITVQLENTVNAKVGDMVRIQAGGGNVIGSAAFVYLLPIIMMVAGMVYGSRLAQMVYPGIDTDAIGLIFGLTALVLFYFLLRTVDDRLALTGRNKPKIISILNR
jgi:sigma-E factor negative regulatory protein RseC